MANLRADNLSGSGGRNAIDGSVFFELGDRLQVPSSTYSTNFNLGGDFTIEGWIKPSIFTSYPSILHLDDSTNSKDLYINFRNGATLGITNNSTVFATSPSFTLNEWAHFAVVRNSNSVTVYCNGVGGSSASCTTDFGAGNQNLYIGVISSLAASDRYRGYMSNFRIVKGTALYTANFTPPTEKLTQVDGTVLLCCQDSDDPTQEATGKTINGYGNLDYSLRKDNLIINGNFRNSATDGWTVASGSAALGTGQSGTFGDGNHLVLTGGNMYQAFTTVIGRTYFVCCQSNGSDSSRISTSTSTGDAIITDIRSSPANLFGSGVRGHKSFVATQTTYYVILSGGGTGNFDTVSVYEAEPPKAPKVLPPVGVDEGVVFEGDTKVNTQSYMYFPTGDTAQRGRGRGVISQGMNPSSVLVKTLQYIEIQSMGNTVDFGDNTDESYGATALSSSTRGITALGATSNSSPYTVVNTLDYITIATTANATDFGDLVVGAMHKTGMSNNTRGVIAAGFNPNTRVMDLITIASTGDATDFGDSIGGRFGMNQGGQAGSSTRGLLAGGESNSAPFEVNKIQYITFASAADSQDFGDLNDNNGYFNIGASSDTRAVFAGGDDVDSPYPTTDRIDYVTIATLGNATDFGNLSVSRYIGYGMSNGIRGVFAGGVTIPGPTIQNTIDYVTIATTGNANDFGDMTEPVRSGGGISDSHGGLA